MFFRGNHHLGADKFQHFCAEKRGGGEAGEGSRFILSK